MHTKEFNPFRFETWIGWLAASLIFAATGTFAVINYVDGKYVTIEQAKVHQENMQSRVQTAETHVKELMEEIKKSVDKLDAKMDRLLESRD